MLQSNEFIYRLQGWFELSEQDFFSDERQFVEVATWLSTIDEDKKNNVLYYIESMMGAIESGGNLTNISRAIAAYLDKNFEHHMPSKKDSAFVLQPAALASKNIKLKDIPELSDVWLAYRVQGYVELSKDHYINAKQLNLITQWCDKTPNKKTTINMFFDDLVQQKNDKYFVYDFLQYYFKNYVDPSYAGNPNILNDIHFGVTNTLKASGSMRDHDERSNLTPISG